VIRGEAPITNIHDVPLDDKIDVLEIVGQSNTGEVDWRYFQLHEAPSGTTFEPIEFGFKCKCGQEKPAPDSHGEHDHPAHELLPLVDNPKLWEPADHATN
jgi:hypothetical protein